MRVKIGPYRSWFGPYQLADALCFWVKPVKDKYGVKDKPEWVHDFGEWLAYGYVKTKPKVGDITDLNEKRKPTIISNVLTWIDSLKKRKMSIHIDKWDTWNMNTTLAHIIVPMLKQLKETKHGAPYVNPADCPDSLKPKKLTKKQKENGETDSTHFERWEWVLDEMIWAFEQEIDENAESRFYSGESDVQWKRFENGMSEMIYGPLYTFEVDDEGLKKFHLRKQNGFILFGKYYQSLWD